MSSLKNKYKTLVDLANSSSLEQLEISESDGQLMIKAKSNDANVIHKLWDTLNQLDPNYIGGEVNLNITLLGGTSGVEARVITEKTNLNIRQGPGTELPIIGKAAKNEIIVLISRAGSDWWLVRTKDSTEGYCFAQYLEVIK